MHIEYDRKAYAKRKPIVVGLTEEFDFAGLCNERDVFIPPHHLIDLIKYLSHEMGHAYSRLVSFIYNVIRFNEAAKLYLTLDQNEINFLRSHFKSRRPIQVDKTLISMVSKAFYTLSPGNVSYSQITVHPVSREELNRVAKELGVNSGKINHSGSYQIDNSKGVRNAESQAYYIQYLVCKLFENTIRHYIDPFFEFKFEASDSGGHRRGQAVAARAVKYDGKIPSQIDLTAKG